MFSLIFAILLGLAYPKHTTVPNNGGTAITATSAETDQPDTGGESGQLPPPK